MTARSSRMSAIHLLHGGGPWPFVALGGFVDREERDTLAHYLSDLPSQLPQRPLAMLVVSAHWEEPVRTVMSAQQQPMLHDCDGFPLESYRITWPAPGQPRLAARVQDLLT